MFRSSACGHWSAVLMGVVVHCLFWYGVQPCCGQGVVLNEINYRPSAGKSLEFVELLNASSVMVDLSDWELESGINYRFRDGTILLAGEYLVLAKDPDALSESFTIPGQLFGPYLESLDNNGDNIRLVDDRDVTRDRVHYDNDFPWPTDANGVGGSLERLCPTETAVTASNWTSNVAGPTPGSANNTVSCPPPAYVAPEVVLNEIHYNSTSPDSLSEYIELRNTTEQVVDVSNWQLVDGIKYIFPPGTTIGAQGTLVVARNATSLISTFGINNVVGDWDGKLSDGGERVELVDATFVSIDAVKFADSGEWPERPDGYGFSLEKLHPGADGSDPASWRSAVGGTYKATFQSVDFTETATSSTIVFYAEGDAEFLIDDLSITAEADPGLEHVSGGDFETGIHDWALIGNHVNSRWQEFGGVDDSRCLRIIASDVGDASSNSVLRVATVPLTAGATYRVRFKYKLLSGDTPLVCMLSGSSAGSGVFGRFAVTPLVASPGAENTVTLSSLPPFVNRIEDLPRGPRSTDSVVVACFVRGLQPVSSVILDYRADTGVSGAVQLLDDGNLEDGLAGDHVYIGQLPLFPDGVLVRYSITALDVSGASWVYPQGNEESGKGAFFVNDNQPPSSVATYHLLHSGDINNLSCDHYVSGHFVSNGKVFLNVGIRNNGDCSRPKRSLRVRFNGFRIFEGRKKINLNSLWSDKSLIREELTWDVFRDQTLAYSKAFHVRVHHNSSYHGLFLFVEVAGTDYLVRNQLDPKGNLYKSVESFEQQEASIEDYKLAYSKRTNKDGDYSDLALFLGELNTVAPGQLLAWVHRNIEIESEIDYQTAVVGVASTDHNVSNHFLYHDPNSGLWRHIIWDVDLSFGRFFDALNGKDLNDAIDPTLVGLFYGEGLNNMTTRFFEASSPAGGGGARYFDRALLGRVWAHLREKRSETTTRAKIEKLRARLMGEQIEDFQRWGRFPGTPDPLHPEGFDDNVDQILGVGSFEGTGFLGPRVAFLEGELAARGFGGFPWVRITEIMYHPQLSDTLEFLEFTNTESTAVDVSGWYVTLVDFEFPSGSMIPANATVVLARDVAGFFFEYGRVADFGPYPGKLNNNGGDLRLMDGRPGLLPGTLDQFPAQHPVTIDSVFYRDQAPWPVTADGFGTSLELRHLTYDNDFDESWRNSLEPGGSPGVLNTINLRPDVEFGISPLSGQVPLNVTFDATGTTDLDGDTFIVVWDFGDSTTSAGALVNHTYASVGTYSGSVTIDDGLSKAVVKRFVVTVAPPPNASPVLDFSVTPLKGEQPLAVSFDASASFDPDGDVFITTWDFGDGASAAGLLTTHTYAGVGAFVVSVSLDDGVNDPVTSTLQVTVISNDNCSEDPKKTEPGTCGCGVADTDTDGDGTADCNDLCPSDPSKIVSGECGCGVPETDSDGDGMPDCNDGCPADTNKISPGQCGCGVADTDTDNDGTLDCNENCPDDPEKTESGQCGCGVADTDSDGDGVADCHDVCIGIDDNIDSDGDGRPDGCDACPFDFSKTAPGVCGCGFLDTDTDGDGASDCNDNCSGDPDKREPGTCGCGTADRDTDRDGVADCNDHCPGDPDKTAPGQCGCGIADTDTDNDGAADCNDDCPGDPDKVLSGICGCGFSDVDSDGDGVAECNDLCPEDPNKASPGQCGCGSADTDTDGDGTVDCNDNCPSDPNKTFSGQCGCGTTDTDTDGDGTANCNDNCPDDPDKTEPGQCGCGVANTDSDSDGVANCHDVCAGFDDNIDSDGDLTPDGCDFCPLHPAKSAPGVCGCGVADTDRDGDGTADCNDACPNDFLKAEAGICGCDVSDIDSDGDGVANCNDLCPNDSSKVSEGQCGCGVPDSDSDGDGVAECDDLCPNDPIKTAPGHCGCGFADTDTDEDSVADCNDLCPSDRNKTVPGHCGCGEIDTDSDGDGMANCNDSCPGDPDKTEPGQCGCGVANTDSDSDGVANCHDLCPGFDDNIDSDGDSTPDGCDLCPSDFSKTAPGVCGCGVADTDADGDGAAGCNDNCPDDSLKTSPGQCGCGNPETDFDGDGVADCNDNCPTDPNKTVSGQCGCRMTDTDMDGDGVADCNDDCPEDPEKTGPGQCGCGVADTDSDGDGVANCHDICAGFDDNIDSDGDSTPDGCDACPFDPTKTASGVCGCGVGDSDTDEDGVADCNDNCPDDFLKTAPGQCGCDNPETDSDGDGVADCNDLCPGDPDKIVSGYCGCGTTDTDTDGDGTADCNDNCPDDPFKTESGQCGCGVADTDSDGDGVASCHDICAGFDDNIDSDGDNTPDGCDLCPFVPANNCPPVLDFSVTSLEGEAPLEVTFDVSSSFDPEKDMLTASWDFGDATSGTGLVLSHTYSNVGTFVGSVSLDDGVNDPVVLTFQVKVLSPPNLPPVLDFSVTPVEGHAPLEVSLDASSSTDPDGDVFITLWDFGDGSSGAGLTTRHTYSNVGAFVGSVSLDDGVNDPVVSMFQVTVSPLPNRPPVLDFSVTPVEGHVPLEVNLDASSSSDPDGDVFITRWDFGDGSSDAGLTTRHTYSSVGTFLGTVSLNDGVNDPIMSSFQVTVKRPLNRPPVLDFTVTPLEGEVPLEVTLDASPSSDPDGDVFITRWDFGDGISGAGLVASHTYSNPGTYLGSVSLHDGVNDPVVSTFQVVVAPPPNRSPVLQLSVVPLEGVAPLAVTLGVESSMDPDGDDFTASWVFGDGSFGAGLLVNHIYRDPGVYEGSVALNDGLSPLTIGHFQVRVSPSPNLPPVLDFSVTPLQGEMPLEVTFDASKSLDPDGDFFIARWTFGDGSFAVGFVVDHIYTDSGVYEGSVVLDDGVSPLTTGDFQVTVTVIPPEIFQRGDVNGDGRQDISDAILILVWQFLGGADPLCLDAADVDDDERVDLTDSIWLLTYVLLGGTSIPPPLDDCGEDPTPGPLDCLETICE